MSKGDNLWNLAIAKSDETTGEASLSEEKSIFFIGSKNSGKTSIVLRFLDRDEVPKPTTALEYTYARRGKGHNLAKDVGHIWELGGGTWLSKLLEIPINSDTIMKTALVIVLDLSTPNELWFTLENLLGAASKQIDSVIQDCKHTEPQLREKLTSLSWDRVGGKDHVEKVMMTPFLIPLVIIGSKYDIFQNLDPEKRKIICRTLRFVAHTYGATIQFFSTKQEATMARVKGLITHLVFGTPASKTLQVDHNKPLLVHSGLDSFQQIGSPSLDSEDLESGGARTPLDLWKKAYIKVFPQENTNNPAMVDDPAKDTQYAESAIDQMRIQKDEELERYRRLCERKVKEAQNQAQQEGIVF